MADPEISTVEQATDLGHDHASDNFMGHLSDPLRESLGLLRLGDRQEAENYTLLFARYMRDASQ